MRLILIRLCAAGRGTTVPRLFFVLVPFYYLNFTFEQNYGFLLFVHACVNKMLILKVNQCTCQVEGRDNAAKINLCKLQLFVPQRPFM